MGIAAGVFQGIKAKEGAEVAADAQLQGVRSQEQIARESIAAQKEMATNAQNYLEKQAAQARADLQPFRDSQLNALKGLEGLATAGNPFEQQQRQMATQQIQQQLAAQGLLRSKNQTDLLSNLEVGLAQQNFQNRASLLGSLSNTGATQQLAGIETSLGQGVAGLYGGLGQQLGSTFGQLGAGVGAGTAQAGALIGQGIAGFGAGVGQGINGAGNAAGTIYGNVQTNKRYNQQQAMLNTYLNGGKSPGYSMGGGISGSYSGASGGYSGASLGVDTSVGRY